MASSSKKPQRPTLKGEPASVATPGAAEAAPVIFESPAPQDVEASAPETVLYAPEAVEVSAAPELEILEQHETAKAVEAPVAAAEVLADNVRDVVEQGIVEGRAKFAEVKSAAAEAAAAVEASLGAARQGVLAFNVKAIEAIKADSAANFDMLTSIAGAKSISELITLQTEFARQRFELAASRAKELAALARKVADETAAPIKAHVAKAFKIAV